VHASQDSDRDGLISIWVGLEAVSGFASGTAGVWLDDVTVNYNAVLATTTPAARSLNGNSAVINWGTDETSDSIVEYGPTFADVRSEDVWVFDFSSISVASGITVKAKGSRPLILLAEGPAIINGIIDVSGQPGLDGGLGHGGGGGGGGGAVAIFADSIYVGT